MKTGLGICCILAMILVSGCARTEKVVAKEGAFGVPYESLGTIEVKEKVPAMPLTRALRKGVEVATFGLADAPQRSEYYKDILKKKLAKLAKEQYGAHAVVDVRYWPDPETPKFPEGYLHARGEMVRYLRFPAEVSSEVPASQT